MIKLPEVEVKAHQVFALLLALAAVLLIGGFAHAASPDQPTIPKGEFEVCVFDQEGEPVPLWEFSILTSDGDVVTGTTDDEGCRIGEGVAGPAVFEVGTGIYHEATLTEHERVYEQFTVPPFKQFMPSLGR